MEESNTLRDDIGVRELIKVMRPNTQSSLLCEMLSLRFKGSEDRRENVSNGCRGSIGMGRIGEMIGRKISLI
jgi:hypothetical protein